jgi:hypothetical protein
MDFGWTDVYEKGASTLHDVYVLNDKLDRSKYSKLVTNFLALKKDEIYVMNLNAEGELENLFFTTLVP